MSALIWAHRGASAYAPENTLPAFELAAKMGAEGVELDVHMSLDGTIVVAHDESIDRCSSGTGLIKDMTFDELLRFDFSNHKKGYASTRIPTLEEVYGLLEPTGLTVNVELKTNVYEYEGIEEKLLALAEWYGMESRVYYSSFNHYSLMRLHEIDPEVKVAPLYSSMLYEPWEYARRINAQAVHPPHSTIGSKKYIDMAREAGVFVNAWTVDDPGRIACLNEFGINAIITNVPDVARKIVRKTG